jgi:flagellin
MSLGVLNNLSAIYAENNLNNTNNSLNTVLQQLSSGSKINSGADDAAGLSLVDGLQANSMALAQSQTNASEGVGLLTVADGALSQVTNLLNRAVTLATEASNGTLNSSQDSAANSEYQSILSEINNIGTTTTYNNQTVFGAASPVNIYTGDSSTAGASIDSLNIGTLSSSNVGDTGGTMAYSNGANNVFINLSGTSNAAATDYLNGGASGTTSIDVSYLVMGSNGTSTPSTATITTGGNSGYQNTAAGMITAINNSGLGLNATFATQAQAGVQGGGTQTGIEISGGQISAGTAASTVSTSGILNPTGIPSTELLTQGQTFAFSQGGVNVTTGTGASGGLLTVGSSNDTLQTLATAIEAATNNDVTATVITNGDGSQSLALGNANPTQGALTVATHGGSGSAAPTFTTTNENGTNSPALASSVTSAIITGVAAQSAQEGAATYTLAGASTLTGISSALGNDGTEMISAGTEIQITNNLPGSNSTMTYIMGTGSSSGDTVYTGSDTMASLVSAINTTSVADSLDTHASDANGVLTVNSTVSQTGNTITFGTVNLTNATNQLTMYNPTSGGEGATGALTYTELNAGAASSADDTLTGAITLSTGTQTKTFTATNGVSTYNDLITFINNNSASLGVTAQWSTTMNGAGGTPTGGTDHGILLTSTAPTGASTITTTSNNLGDLKTATGIVVPVTSIYAGAGAAEDDQLNVGGAITLHSNGNQLTFTATAGQTWSDLAAAINGQTNLGLNATWNTGDNALLLTSNIAGTAANVTTSGSTTLGDATLSTAGTRTVDKFTAGASSASTDLVSGTATFTVGSNTFVYTGDGATTTFTDLATALSQSDLGVTATFSNNDLVLTSNLNGAANVTMTPGGSPLTDINATGGHGGALATGTTSLGSVTAVAVDTATNGGVVGNAGTPVALAVDGNGAGASAAGTAGTPGANATAVLQLNQAPTNGAPTTITDGSDQITGQITLTDGTGGHSLTFIQGVGQSNASTIYTNGTTVNSLVTAIQNNSAYLGITAYAPGGGSGAIYLQSTTSGQLVGGITSGANSLADTDYSGSTSGASGGAVTGQTLVTGNAASITVGMTTTGALPAGITSTVNTNDVLLAGSEVVLTNNPGSGSVTDTFIVGANNTGNPAAAHTFYTGASNDTIADLAAAITADSDNGLKASSSTAGLVVTSTAAETGNITLGGATNLADTTLGTYASVSLGNFGSESDTVSGSFNFTDQLGAQTVTATAGQTVAQMIAAINNKGGADAYGYGVQATWQASGGSGAGSIELQSTMEGSGGSISATSPSLTDTATSVNLNYTASNAYSTGISGDATNKLFDKTSGQSALALAGVVANQKSSSGTATISYSDGAGESLSATDLSNQTDAEHVLTALNSAITDVAAQDGYIGAQINTLNSVSSVLSTQQENVISAQNAVQATDYASATSNMSKYEILSQTGIAALAQANSIQQEVTKLLQ